MTFRSERRRTLATSSRCKGFSYYTSTPSPLAPERRRPARLSHPIRSSPLLVGFVRVHQAPSSLFGARETRRIRKYAAHRAVSRPAPPPWLSSRAESQPRAVARNTTAAMS
eukprot:3338185-Prymnesium_polylepis.1